jgi:hypothetical protein
MPAVALPDDVFAEPDHRLGPADAVRPGAQMERAVDEADIWAAGGPPEPELAKLTCR